MFSFGPLEIIAILAIVLLLFGPKRLKNLGSELGGAIKGFRNSITDDERKSNTDRKTIDVDDSDIDRKSTNN